ncbi:MAG: hypothetical protein HDR37_11475 [Treponema sp.]|nr:hypothetical protein [Treponema sp.]
MKNMGNEKTKQYSSVFWVCIRTGGIGVATVIGGIVFLFIEKLPDSAMIPMLILAGAIILVPYIVLLLEGRAEPFDETVQKNRYEALSMSGNLYLEILIGAALVLATAEISDIKVSASATLMFAVAARCFLQCLFFTALEGRSKQDAEAYSEDSFTEGENDF